jgi:hypothetical protein
MSERVISYADLSVINSALRSLSSDMSGVHAELGNLNVKNDQLANELLKLAAQFADFVKADQKNKSLQLAVTREGNLKQDLQIKFGYYGEVRRMATGVLQGVDTGIVGEDTLRFTTEEVVLKAPGYWLAPALVALSAWIRNDKSTAEKALNESLKRDDYKTTLFFMLVMRRLARNEASLKWLTRYFLHQNPHNLGREFIIILEAVSTGIFLPAGKNLMLSHVKDWIYQLTKGDTYINEQKARWIKYFESRRSAPDNKYPLLAQYATNWSALEMSLGEAKTNQVLIAHFKSVIGATDFSKSIKVQLDEILSMLVTNFDDEELPLQEQVRMNQLIIQKDGDKVAAQAVMDAEKQIFDEEVDFLEMLTNASFDPELSGASKATQAFAISIGKPWIVEAHDTFVAQCRNRVPQQIELGIDGFNGATVDGANESELVARQEEHYNLMLKNAMSKLPLVNGMNLVGALIILGSLFAFSSNLRGGITGVIIGVVLIWLGSRKYAKAKADLLANFEERKLRAREVLRGCIAETVDYRKEHAMEDAKAEQVRELLNTITPEDFSSVSKEAVRSII